MQVLVIFTCLVFCHQVASWPWQSNHAEEPEVAVPSGVIQAQGGDNRCTGGVAYPSYLCPWSNAKVPHTDAKPESLRPQIAKQKYSEMEECVRAGREGQCAFYDCLERRFSCLSNGYTERISKHFCLKVANAYDLFDSHGQTWLNKTSICLMREMVTIYSGESTTCAAIRAAGIQGIITCNDQVVENRNFCDFIRGNAIAYSQLMGMQEMRKLSSLGNTEIWTRMITQSLSCGGSALSDAWSSFMSSFTNMGISIASSIRNMFSWN